MKIGSEGVLEILHGEAEEEEEVKEGEEDEGDGERPGE